MGVRVSLSLGCVLVLLSASWIINASPVSEGPPVKKLADKQSSMECIACTLAVGIVEQLSQLYNESIDSSIERLCGYLPAKEAEACRLLVSLVLREIIEVIEWRETPDVICHSIGLCKQQDDSKEICHLFPLPKNESVASLSAKIAATRKASAFGAKGEKIYKLASVDWCTLPLIDTICDLMSRFGDDHLPVEDIDGDHFSDLPTFRGTSWRGKDCDDVSASIYPGRKTTNDAVLDTNCNGIVGIDRSTGKTYEEQWCGGTKPMGTVILGDSVGAHFHIPPEWVTASELSIEVFQDVLFILENEFDWPMLSAITGFKNSTWPVTPGPVDSFYLRMRRQNRCNHRDYQNIAVNGAAANAMNRTIVRSLARNGMLDQPVFINFALIGNDVCSKHHDTSPMTPPEKFYNSNLATFRYLDSIVAPGSVLIASGLADGRVLYDTLHDRIHPIGSTNKDVKYSQFYDYLNCLEISPCFGWLNTNETWRNITYEHVVQLNNALKDLVANETFENLTVHYSNLSFHQAVMDWKDQGKPAWELLEPVDGFHPSQQGQALFAGLYWDYLQKNFPHIIPPANPNNGKIEKMFGDQGGY